MTESELMEQDLEHLATRGIPAAEARRQLELLRTRPAPPPIVGACTLGQGIGRIESSEHPALLALWREAAAAGWVSKFVPASGAATRMFGDLTNDRGEPTTTAREVHAGRAKFAFAAQLEAVASDLPPATSEVQATLQALVSSEGLGLGDEPKALIGFHDYPSGPRTALIEQLVEAAGYVSSGGATIRVHFTVMESHRSRVEGAVAEARDVLETRFAAPLEVSFSVQDPASDTLAIDDAGSPFRGPSGELTLRPSGHGALLDNLQQRAMAAPQGPAIAVVKNIDNIQPEHRQGEVVLWKRLLIGRLLEVEATLAQLEQRVAAGGADSQQAARELAAVLSLEPLGEDWIDWANDRLTRPTRVCGMVRNTGEPGGGPFWVRSEKESATPQIVEAAQIDLEDSAQEAAWRSATHFNPVDLICSLRDRTGQPYDLAKFVDPASAFVSRKESDGRPLWALERPGLWNGAMAGWNTLFVEVPAGTFAPVKTVLDLLRPEHQPADTA